MIDPMKGGKFSVSVMLVASWHIYEISFWRKNRGIIKSKYHEYSR